MSGIDSKIGIYLKTIASGPKIKQILDKGRIDLDGNKIISKDEIVDTDGKPGVSDEELGAFYQKNKVKLYGEKGAKLIDQQLVDKGILPASDVQGPVQAVPDQKAVDGYLTVLLDQNESYENRMSAAKSLIKIISQGNSTKETRKKFAELYIRNVGGDMDSKEKEIMVKRSVYDLLMKEKNTVPFGMVFYSAVAWRWHLEMPKDDNLNVGLVKKYAEGLYEKYGKETEENQKEINKCVSKLDIFTKMWFFMKAAGDKGVDKAIEDHNFMLASKADAMKILFMTINEPDEKLVTPDLRKGAFELYLRLAGKIPMGKYVDQLINLLNFEGMNKYVFQKLMPIVKDEIAYKEKEFKKTEDVEVGTWLNKQKKGEYLYQQSTGWWRLLAYGQYKGFNPLDEYGRTYALQSSNDNTRETMYNGMSSLGQVSVLNKLYTFMQSHNGNQGYRGGRRAESVFKDILSELNKGGNLKLFDSSKFQMMVDLTSLDPGDTYKVRKAIQGTFGFEVTGEIERKPYDYKKDFVIGYYHYLYMDFLSGGKTWESGIITNKPRYSGDETWGCNP